jgi:hypothetical protein
MRKTAKLFLLGVVLFTLCMEANISSSGLDKSKAETFNYVQWKFNHEKDHQAEVERQMLDSLRSKHSIRWVFTGFTDTQIFFESTGNQSAISPEGAQGIAQFMPSTWKFLVEKQLLPEWFDINNEAHQRIAQLVYLDYLYKLWDKQIKDQRALTAASYNAGPNRVKSIVKVHGKAWKSHLPEETQKYLTNLKDFL